MAPLKRFSDIINELSMKSDKKLPNLKMPVKGKKGTSKFMRMKVHNAPYTSDYKKAMNAGFKTDANRKAAFAKMNDDVQSADRKPEKYIKPDGKVGVRMVKTDKQVIKKESIDNHPKVKAARKAHAAGTWDGNVDKEGEAVVHINGKPHTVTNRYSKKKKNEAINHDDAHRDAQTHSDGSMSVKKIPSMIKKPGDKHLHLHMKSYHKEKDGQDFAKKHGYKVKNYVKTPSGTRMDIHKESIDEAVKNLSATDQVKAAIKIIRDKRFNDKFQIDKKTAIQKISKDLLKDPKVKKEIDKIYEENIDEALNLAQRMKRSRLMKRMKSRIKIGRQRAMKKMANKKTIEKRAMRQARQQIAKKLTRGIPKGELTFARKQEIEKRLAKPALQQRIKRMAKRIFKDVRKKEVERKKG